MMRTSGKNGDTTDSLITCHGTVISVDDPSFQKLGPRGWSSLLIWLLTTPLPCPVHTVSVAPLALHTHRAVDGPLGHRNSATHESDLEHCGFLPLWLVVGLWALIKSILILKCSFCMGCHNRCFLGLLREL
uniref:Uncharacterized protein n=1 Tax=Molossus molossus TaxID=27622 RepID=A0A7J8HI21_MOLMO|nr:hypothetical protein HJG59_011050 [Molossus molossus]